MTIRNGRFIPKSEEQILADILDMAEDSWGRELTNDETAALVHFYRPLAEHFAMQQEDLAAVLDSTQLAHAEGQALDYLAELIGVSRRQERPATGRVRFQSDNPVERSFSIPGGTGVQTEDTDPVRFRTDNGSTLPYIDGFEDGDIGEYSGDTSAFAASQTQAETGDWSLSGSAVGDIADLDRNVEYGTRFHLRMWFSSSAVGSFLFGMQDFDNYYRLRVDDAGAVELYVASDGTESLVDDASAVVPAGEWIDVQFDWRIGGDHEVVVTDASGSNIATFNATEVDASYEDGGIGFGCNSTNTVYFDEVTTSYTSVAATATETGERTNVGPETLNTLSSSVSGVDSVTNPLGMTGGRELEPDEDFRDRVEDDLSAGTSATQQAVINAIEQIADTQTVTVVVNRSSAADGDGRPAHSVEAVVDSPEDAYSDIAEALLDTLAAGDQPVGGYAGVEITRLVELSNGQEEEMAFSAPTPVSIGANVDLEVTGDYVGDDRVQSAIVQYIGGELPTGDNVDGDLDVGDDVIYNKVMGAVANVEGVHDVTTLEINSDGGTFGTSNITIADTENADSNGTDSSLSITTVEV